MFSCCAVFMLPDPLRDLNVWGVAREAQLVCGNPWADRIQLDWRYSKSLKLFCANLT